MSQYYKPNRRADWNYGGPRWRLSRSKIDLFVECPRCFYIDNKLGTARPRGYPFTLNSAVDYLLKKEFDAHRKAKTAHPIMIEYGIDAIPFEHEKMEVWRDSFKGVETKHAPTGFTVSGAVDDIWVNPKGEVHVVDYKATSKDGEVSLDAQWQDGYKRQMEVYQWLLRQNGLEVSDTGYFVYVNGRTDVDGFDNRLEFESKVIPYIGSGDWIEKTLANIKACLDSKEVPKKGSECDYCPYRTAAGKALLKKHSEKKMGISKKEDVPKAKPRKTKESEDQQTSSLF